MNNIELKLIKEYVDKKVESGLPGAPGDSVVNVEKNQGNLIIYLSHYNTETGMNIVTPVNLGSIIGPQGDKGQHGDGYTSIQINNNGDLIATKEVYSAQGSTPASQQINLGHVVGTDYVLTNEDKAEIAESINLSSKQDKAPDGDNLLIDSSTGKINAAYIPDSLLGQIIFGGTISNVEADAGDDLVLRVALSATAKNILHSNSNYYTLYPHGPEYNAADCANMFFIYNSPQVNMSFDNIGVLNSGDWVISTGDAWQKIDNTDSVTSVNGKVGNVVLKTSDLQNDSGFLTQHQDISGKADKSELNKILQTAIDAGENLVNKFSIVEGFLGTGGTIVSPTDNQKTTDFIPCQKNDKFISSILTKGQLWQCYVIYNSQKEKIGDRVANGSPYRFYNNVTELRQEVTITSDSAAFIRFSTGGGEKTSFNIYKLDSEHPKAKIENINTKIFASAKQIGQNLIEVAGLTNGFVNASGLETAPSATNNEKITEFIPVALGEKYRARVAASSNNFCVMFYDSNKQFLNRVVSPLLDYNFTIDNQSAAYMRISAWQNNLFEVKLMNDLTAGTRNVLKDIKITDGYIAANGTIANPTNANEIVSDYIFVKGDENIHFHVEVEGDPWLAIAFYNEDKELVGTRITTNKVTLVLNNQRYLDLIEDIPSAASFARVSCRTYDNATYGIYVGKQEIIMDVFNNRLSDALSTIRELNHEGNYNAVNHKGFNLIAPENTAPAFLLSKKLGFSKVECDIRLTSDDIPVLLHEEVIDGVSNGTGRIDELTLAEVSTYDFGSWKSNIYAGTNILTLEDFIKLCHNIGLHPYIELKQSTPFTQANINNIINIVNQNGMRHKCTYISASDTCLNYIKNVDSKARLGYVVPIINSTVITQCQNLKTSENEVFIDCNYVGLTNEHITLCKEANLPMEVWAINDISVMQELPSYITGATSDWLNINVIKHDKENPGTQGIHDIQGSNIIHTIQNMNGFSPTATVTKSGSTATIRITDKNGTTTATIVDGNNYVLTNADKEDIAEEAAGMITTTYAKLASPALTGTPTAPTAAAGTNTTQIATTAFVNNAIKNYSEVPSYVIEESESVLSKAFSHNTSNKTLRFIAVSDGHNDATEVSHDYTKIANLHCGQAIKYIADRIPLDFVAFLGDMTWAGVSGETYTLDMVKQDIQEMNSFLAAGFKGIPNIRVIGNHDQCLCSGSRLQNKEAYNLIGRYNSGEKTFDNYGYYDLDFAKVRIIYLNTSEITNANSSNAGAILNISQNQKNWLAELLISTNQKTDANDWRILILSHAPLDMVGNIGTDILIPYTNGGSYNSYNFTNHNVEILGNIHGHVHCFSYGYISNKIRRFTIPNSNFYDNNHYRTISGYESWSEQTTYPKTANSRTDTSFSLVTMDLENDICYVDNYGAGIDRVFSLGYLKTATSISNISYSGPTTVGTVIDINNINYTLTYSDNSTSILSGGNITVSPSTISTVGNNTITISYSDGTSSLSDSITIIGTAIPVNNLLNLDRTFESLDAGVNITTALNENKAYTNISYGSGNADAKINSVANVTTDSITITEPGVGGIEVAFPIQLDPTKQYRLTYDYSGPGKVRGHARWWGASTGWTGQFAVYDGAGASGNTAGASGTYTTVLPSHSGSYTWLIIMLGSNTSGTKTFSNVSLVEEVAN